MNTGHNDLEILEQDEASADLPLGSPWKLLVVDDEDDVHAVTKMALANFEFRNRPLDLLHAHSAKEAKQVLAEHEDIAVILLDVVMETDHAGLELTDYIRNHLQNRRVRIVLRTGQAGQAPPRQVVRKYDISDYREKSELTMYKLDGLVCTSLSVYEFIGDLERSNDDLQHFAYVVSHDLQAPIRTITGFVRLLEKSGADKLDSEEMEYLGFIHEGAKRLHSMIQSILSLSRLSTEAKDLESVDLNKVIREVMLDLRMEIEASAADIRFKDLPTVTMEPTQASILFRNLLHNAIRYAREGQPPVVEITAMKVAGGWQIAIHDNGIGFEQKDAERIFQIFARLHNNEDSKGTGIGLALCEKIMRRHEGSISAESRLGEGSVFQIFLPDAPQESL